MIRFLFVCITTMCIADSFDSQAEDWFSWHATNASPEELQMLANVVYFSWQRNEATLRAQEDALVMLDHMWRAWHAIAFTRRNPSHIILNDCTPTMLDTIHRRFYLGYKRYRSLSKTYDVMTTIVAQQPTSTTFKSALAAVKTNARLASLNVLHHIIELFNSESDKAYERLNQAICQVPKLAFIWWGIKKSCFTSFLTAPLIPSALQAFALFDNQYIAASSACWEALLSSQKATNLLWNRVAKIRASFYEAHYRVIYRAMQQRNLPLCYFNLLFDTTGIICEDRRKSLLPVP